ncbi:MAG: holin family protein [Pseudomonadota bacterium]
MIGSLLGMLFGGGRNAIRETVEIFRPNAEAEELRAAAKGAAALSQFASEFGIERKGWFDRFIDGLNRLPRPMLALGTLALFVAAMTDPIWFAQRMQGIALVPEPLWWLMGAIVSFYFGARHQAKTHDLHRSLAGTLARTPEVIQSIEALGGFREAEPIEDVESVEASFNTMAQPALLKSASAGAQKRYPDNAALEDWRLSRER